MLIKGRPVDRRRVLRGVLNGAAVTVALPILDCMLNDSGTAFAATGQPLPVRFGTWFWGLGIDPVPFTPRLSALAMRPRPSSPRSPSTAIR